VEAADPAWTSTGLTFVAANSEFVDIQSPAPISASATWTVILVLKSGGAANQCVFSEGSSASGNQFLALFQTATVQRVQYRDNAATVICDVNSTAQIYDDSWRFLAVRRNGTTLTIVIDGVSEDIVIGSGTTLTLNRQGFGALLRNTNGSFANQTLAYGITFDKDLSDGEIQAVRSALTEILTDRGIELP
jgi:hypothetical protein